MLRFTCPRRKSLMDALDTAGGSKIACHGCGQRLQVPMPPPSKTILAPLVEHTPTALQPGQFPAPTSLIASGAIQMMPRMALPEAVTPAIYQG